MSWWSLLLFLATITITITLSTAADTADACNSYNVTTVPAGSELTVDQINTILEDHNSARRDVKPYAKEMPMLLYDVCLEKLARDYIKDCPGFQHSSQEYRRKKCNYSYVGENIAVSSRAPYPVKRAVKQWNDEVSDWSYPRKCVQGKACGHYTQNIWAKTTHIGCAFHVCNNVKAPPHAFSPTSAYWVCEYGEGGNYGGQAPYVKVDKIEDAAACTKGKENGNNSPAPPQGGEEGSNNNNNNNSSGSNNESDADGNNTTSTNNNSGEDSNSIITPVVPISTLLFLFAVIFY